ncbi:MAG: leucine-rich repeat domain-containing protein [Spirochaetaceae bacterium]|jgi:hypothetical protein|nr:leucine-rich repeat domain-containing protein [Spirochaetaceae bacterium]
MSENYTARPHGTVKKQLAAHNETGGNRWTKRKTVVHGVLLAALTLAACSSDPAVTGVPVTQDVHTENGPTPQDTPAYWTGDGAKGLSITVALPESRGLAAEEAYLPVMVQGVLERDFRKFSAMTVRDRQETAGAGQYLLNGVLRKTASGFSLQLTITDAMSGLSKAAHTDGFPAADLENLSSVKKAAADLLAQLGVTLTDAGRTSLLTGETSNVAAETALAKGVIAQRKGAAAEALNGYYEAAKFDPGLSEAAALTAALLADIAGGNERGTANAIQRRTEWVRILQEAAVFFKKYPPYEIIYDSVLTQGKFDYDRETIEISFDAKIIGTTGFKVIDALDRALHRTGGSGDWGIGVDSIWREIPGRYEFDAVLVNEAGETIGRTSGSFEPEKNLDFSHAGGRVYFAGVDARKATGGLSASIAGVHGSDGPAAGEQGYMRISREDFAALEVPPFKIDWRLGGIEITGYAGTGGHVVIPSTIGRWPVSAIGDRAFRGKRLTGVTLPDTIITIGSDAFSRNELAGVAIPAGVRSIGEAAFRDNRLTSVTIPDSVHSIGHWAFSKLTHITIPANVALDNRGSFFGFDTFYEDNGRKAGTYIQDIDGKWSIQESLSRAR